MNLEDIGVNQYAYHHERCSRYFAHERWGNDACYRLAQKNADESDKA